MNLAVGQVISLKATVKKHEYYTPKFEGAPTYAQTTLTRCALVVRAKVTGYEVEEKTEQKCSNKDVCATLDAEGRYISPTYVDVKVKYHHYSMVDAGGRPFVVTSKSKKKALVVGVTAIVEYAVEDLSCYNNGRRPASLVEVVA